MKTRTLRIPKEYTEAFRSLRASRSKKIMKELKKIELRLSDPIFKINKLTGERCFYGSLV